MITYNIPLLNDSYNYHQEEKKLPGGTPALFITIKTISGYTQNMISTLQSAEIELSHQQQKGAIYCFVLHLLLIILMISIFKTIFTHAGLVSKEINLKTEEKATRALEIEKRVLRNRWKKRKELNSKATESQKEEESVIILNKEGNITVENQPLISDKNSDREFHHEEEPQEQGDQGEDGSVRESIEDPQFLEQLNQIALYNAMKRENIRFCAHCQKFKPERTHHCKQCNTCILKMDHHCPWVGRCIGFFNYKYFLNMVLYGVLSIWFMVITYTEAVTDTIFNLEIPTWKVFIIFFTYALSIVLGIILTGFFCFHLWLVSINKTTLEYCENKKNAAYDMGTYQNLKSVLGNNILLWCLPCAPNLEGEGIHFTSKANKVQYD